MYANKYRNRLVPKQKDFSLFVERDVHLYFSNFLTQSERTVFPILGPGGVGKTWQMQRYINSLSEHYLPIILSARLLTNIHAGVRDAFLNHFNDLDRNACKTLASTLQKITTLTPKKEKDILLFIDGLNEYHFVEGSLEKAKEDFITLINILNLNHIRLIFSCRTFTWNEFIRDSATEDFFYISDFIYQSVTIEKYDYKKGKNVEKIINERVNIYGLPLKDFTRKEKKYFWSSLQKKYSLTDQIENNYSQINNPFFLGVLANLLELNPDTPPPPWFLFPKYIEKILSKSCEKDRRDAIHFLYTFTNFLITGSGTAVLPSISNHTLGTLKNDHSLLLLLDLGLIKSSDTDRCERVYYFAHDVLLHYFVSKTLKTRFNLSFNSPNSFVIIFKIAKASIRHSKNDYLKESIRFMVNCFVEDFGFCKMNDYLPSKIFILLINSLKQTHPNELFLQSASLEILNKQSYGTVLSFSIKNSPDKKTINKFLNEIKFNENNEELISNCCIIARASDYLVSLDFCKKVSKSNFGNLTKMRCAFTLGEFSSKDSVSVILELLDFKTIVFHSLNNACIYALGKLGHQLEDSQMKILKMQIGSAWRLGKYKKMIEQSN